MLRSFYAGISGLRNHQQAMDVVGNNLANVNTTAYKASRTTFMDTLSQTIQGSRTGSSTQGGKNPMQVGLGMTIAAIDRDTSQGALQSTGRNLDMAIEGEGWFVVGETNASTNVDNYFYTRVGNFFIDDKANLVTAGGDKVYGWVDTDSSGTVDTTSDDMKFINLDRLKSGAITNVLATSTPPVQGPNAGNASISGLKTSPETKTDTWTVTCVDANLGRFEVKGYKSNVVGTFSYDSRVVDQTKFGSFDINMGAPARAGLSVPFTAKDGSSEIIHLTNNGANPLTLSFTAAANNGGVKVTQTGSDVHVTMDLDANGVVSSTYEQVAAALQAANVAGFGATYDAGSSQNVRAQALVNQFKSIPAGGSSDLNLGDVGPVGVLSWSALEMGSGGNNLNVQLVNGGSQQKTTVVTVDGSDITITLRADSSSKVVATAAEVYDAFNANPDALKLATMTDPGLSGGLVVEPSGTNYFTGGEGANQGDYFTFSTTAPGDAKLQSLSVNREGGIIGVFENGSTEEIARVAVARVPNPQGMLADGQGKFSESPSSGTGFPPVVAGSNGTGGIASGFLEMSNVDLTREFTEMIVDQRGFQANSRIITTSDEMLQELMQIKR